MTAPTWAAYTACRTCYSELEPQDITEETFERQLQTWDMPVPDLLIRTSGEQRLSNFLLYKEKIITQDFT